MAGIPGTGGVRETLHGVTRVLLRIAVLVGLVVCGWLLGTGAGLADEAGADEAGAPSLLTPLVEAGVGELAPVGEVLRAPAQLPVPTVVSQAVGPLVEPVVEPVVESVADDVLGLVTPEPTDQPVQSDAEVADGQSAPAPAEPIASTTGTLPAAPLLPPMVQAPAPVAPPALSSAAAPAVDRIAGASAAVDERSTPPVPASPLGTLGTSCPAGPTGANNVAQAAHAAMLSDGVARADLALVQRRVNSGAGGLPRCPSQQPSTSPD